MSAATVVFHHPPPVVFGYLADPRNRPEWQSSLRAVDMIDDGEPRLGMRWHDVTTIGVRPMMMITAMTPYRLWSEAGIWRGITAHLTLRFTGVPTGTRVTAEVVVDGGGLWRAVSVPVRRLAPAALSHDLGKANEALERRRPSA